MTILACLDQKFFGLRTFVQLDTVGRVLSIYYVVRYIILIYFFFKQDLKIDDLETSNFVLVHGGGFGAWCWYKTIALLEEVGFKVTAIDLTGAGIDSSNTNNITSLSQYVKPLTDYLEKLGDGEKVSCFLRLLTDSAML